MGTHALVGTWSDSRRITYTARHVHYNGHPEWMIPRLCQVIHREGAQTVVDKVMANDWSSIEPGPAGTIGRPTQGHDAPVTIGSTIRAGVEAPVFLPHSYLYLIDPTPAGIVRGVLRAFKRRIVDMSLLTGTYVPITSDMTDMRYALDALATMDKTQS